LRKIRKGLREHFEGIWNSSIGEIKKNKKNKKTKTKKRKYYEFEINGRKDREFAQYKDHRRKP
jgi:hypothetical protein